jgi:hypothetical protein
MPRKSQGEKDKEKKKLTSSVKLHRTSKLLASRATNHLTWISWSGRGIILQEVHQAKRTITKIRKIKRTRGRSIKRTKRRRKRTNAVKIPQDHWLLRSLRILFILHNRLNQTAHQTPVSPVQARVKDRKSERGRLYLCSLYPHLRCLPPHHPRRSLVTRARYAFCR